MKQIFNEKFLVVLVLLLAFFLRVVNIDSNPPSLYGDELTLVYDAYSILKTGHDQTGAFLPLTFSMSEGRPPVYVYLSIPLVAVFGPNALSARFISIMSGVGIVLLIYLLLQSLISKRAALLGALLVAISPWDLSLSRGGFETHLALLFTLLGIYTFLQAKIKPWYLLITAITFGLALFTYHAYKVVIPLLLPLLFWFTNAKQLIKEKQFQRSFILSGIVFFTFVALWFYQVIGGSEVRFQNTSILNKEDLSAIITQKINTERTLDTSPFKFIIHNKPIEYLMVLGENYFSHFSFDFLFLHGDKNPRHNQGLMGEMYLAEFLLILLGIVFLWQQNKKTLLLLSCWILISPLATMLVSSAHALRSSFLLLPLSMLSAVGFSYLWELSKKKWLEKTAVVIVIIALAVQFTFLIDRVYFLYPKQFGHFWSLLARNVSKEAVSDSAKFDYVVISDQIDAINLAFPVYAKIDPNKVIVQYNKQLKQYGNIYIGDAPVLSGQGVYYNKSYSSGGLPDIQRVIK